MKLQKFNNCIPLDLVCNFIQKPKINTWIQYLKYANLKLLAAKYDVEHPVEFQEWQKINSKILSQPDQDLRKLLPTPGMVHYFGLPKTIKE